MVLQQKLLEKTHFIFELTGRAMVRPGGPRASSDKWKVPVDPGFHAVDFRIVGNAFPCTPCQWNLDSGIRFTLH